MAKAEHVSLVKGLVAEFATWRSQNPTAPLDLTDADLSHVAIGAKDLTGADLSNARLLSADLTGANLTRANARNADLSGARAVNARFDFADCTGAKFDRADLTGATWTGSTIHSATFEGSIGVPLRPGGILSSLSVGDHGFSVIIAVLAAIGFFLIGWFVRDDRISEITYARGVVTVVFTVGTVSIAFILVAAMWLSNSDDAAQRFGNAKEILTILIGILGTVVGWYFGQQAGDTRPPTPLSVAGVLVANQEPTVDGTTKIKVLVAGGIQPYTYLIEPVGQPVFAKMTATLPETVSEHQLKMVEITKDQVHPEVTRIKVTVTDGKGQSVTYTTPPAEGLVCRPKPKSK